MSRTFLQHSWETAGWWIYQYRLTWVVVWLCNITEKRDDPPHYYLCSETAVSCFLTHTRSDLFPRNNPLMGAMLSLTFLTHNLRISLRTAIVGFQSLPSSWKSSWQLLEWAEGWEGQQHHSEPVLLVTLVTRKQCSRMSQPSVAMPNGLSVVRVLSAAPVVLHSPSLMTHCCFSSRVAADHHKNLDMWQVDSSTPSISQAVYTTGRGRDLTFFYVLPTNSHQLPLHTSLHSTAYRAPAS